jgi:hypothetical protein
VHIGVCVEDCERARVARHVETDASGRVGAPRVLGGDRSSPDIGHALGLTDDIDSSCRQRNVDIYEEGVVEHVDAASKAGATVAVAMSIVPENLLLSHLRDSLPLINTSLTKLHTDGRNGCS